MKQSKWPDFLFTLTVRFLCGIVCGGLLCCLFSWRGILRAFSHDNTHGPLIWLGLCVLGGGIIAVFTIPYWQTPWYKRPSERVDVEEELALLSRQGVKLPANVVKQSPPIKTVGQDGEAKRS